MAESFTRTGFAVVSASLGSDANAESFAGREFEVYLKFCPLDRRSVKRYIDCIQTQMNLENLIFQASQTPAVGKPINPYQGLKPSPRISPVRSLSRKTHKSLPGIET